MRILHVTEVRSGGVLSLLELFLPGQVEAGHEVHVLSNDDFPDVPGVTRHLWRYDRRRPWTLANASRALRATIKKVDPDVVHLHSFFAGIVGRLPLVLGSDAPALVYQPHSWSDSVDTRWGTFPHVVRYIERRAGKRTDLLITNCTDEIEHGRSFGVDTPARPIGIAVDPDHFRPATPREREEARRAHGFTADDKVAVLVGRLSWQKAQDVLVAEWEKHPPNDGLRLVLVGPGDPGALAALAPTTWNRSVEAVGGTDDVRSWLWAADVLVLCSRYEGMAVTLGEAMSVGLPAVSTAVSGAGAALTDGPCPPGGVLVPAGDAAGLLSEVRALLDDPVRYRAMSEAGPVRTRAEFLAEDLLQRLEQTYREAITERRSMRAERGVA